MDAARIQKTNARAHVDGAHGAIYISGAAKACTVALVELGGLRGGWVDLGDSMHGVGTIMALTTLCEAARPG